MRAAQPARCRPPKCEGRQHKAHVTRCAASRPHSGGQHGRTARGRPQQQRTEAAPPATSAGAPALGAATAPVLSCAQLLRYERRGHVCTRRLFSPEEVQHFVPALTAALETERLRAYQHRVQVLCPPEVAAQHAAVASVSEARRLLQQHAHDTVGFLQVFNLHRRPSPVGLLARCLVTCGRLSSVAAALLAARRVRVYQSCVFIKEPGMGMTNWHSDLNMVPLDTNAFVTAWIPLRSLTADDAALEFASGSHRDFALPYWHTDASMSAGLENRGYAVESYSPPLALGDVTWHHGWTLHCAPEQPLGRPPRHALAVSFFADGARRLPGPQLLRREPHNEDAASCADWLSHVQPGAAARHAALPLVHGDD